MIKSVQGLEKRLGRIEKDIFDLKSDVALEQLENNKWLTEIVDELTIIKEDVSEILFDKYKDVVPEDENPVIGELFSHSEQLRSIMKMLGKDSEFVERFGFDRTIYEVGNGTNVDELNETLKNFILDMDSIGIELDYTNFNYSVFTTKYMKVFFENVDNENYRIIMKKCFVNIYWECPELLTHLELCVRCLVFNNKSMIVRHLNHLLENNLKKVGCDKNDLISLYVKTKKKFLDLREADFYHIYSFFKSNPNEIAKYVNDNTYYTTLGKFTDVNKFSSYSDEDKKFFMTNIRELYNDLNEYKMLSKFRGIFYYLIDLLKTADPDAQVKYKIARKDANKYEAIKTNLDKKLGFLIKKRDYLSDKNKEKMNKVNEQIKEYSARVSSEIVAIKNEIDLIGHMRFLIDFKTEINETSTLFEVAYFVSKYYGELTDIVREKKLIDEDRVRDYVDEFRHIQYDPNLTVMNNVAFISIDDINELIERKYGMHDIKINIPDDETELNNMLDDLKYLIRFDNIELLKLAPEDIQILLKVRDKMES